MNLFKKQGVLILDFGSQYTQLIARRVREQHVYSEILQPNVKVSDIVERNPSAIILSGGPSSVFGKSAPEFDISILDLGIPILGICYGLQLLVHHSGGKVESTGKGEYGFAKLNIQSYDSLFNAVSERTQVWMSHMDHVTHVPEHWSVLAESENGIIASLCHDKNKWYATQFHPEVIHTIEGEQILQNFLFNVSECSPTWTSGNFIKEQVEQIQKQVGDGQVLVGVSGGVDSSVVAALLHKAIGEQSSAVLIDHGLLRKNEANLCVHALKDGLGVKIQSFNESNVFLPKLNGISDPEKKRKIIGEQFIRSFESISDKLGDFSFLAQGTLYPDVIESGVSHGKTAHVIKSHHNVGGLPDDIDFELVEPLRELFKDEVRNVGRELGLPDSLIDRHPFPGPGLAVRIIGKITEERIQILQNADQIYMEILHDEGIYHEIWQAFAVLIPIKTVGVMGDQRTYENLCGIRAVTSHDGMTADWYRMPEHVMARISSEIVNSVRGINRVVYDITSKPPGTIEWE
ncbi:MAG: glutamine-hydrolyzing GMP synthase [Candidatus Marinimicrobia bacterium]|jgi:GMP synthase (glutamine-hydrolysing)|nr:glutamine-hydrolyzing GMP synthase [Candidatus Neomarinimicrobiota bacterium]MBT3937808.1 glutamine-hydrolyzing GMP synthase [Candidatus Neomarinimicrobiota bacterium]MBT3960623.1 glutamine-hydrolyzing GMP synthase [Candidatus Neomarinimicrobiota bacterium]MBT4383911.1 glutamine-hydrolyzing GMP synthase [Candidatus Neomarinimicrobiota bacterium]MBT4636037.1 glutamine-hydrolyzing GMP synthase [Candidatus Neomarinimicrobiota bacterium]